MDIWQHKESKRYYVQVGDTGSKLTLITPIEGIKTFNRENFEFVITEDIKSLNEKGLLTESQINQCKNSFPESPNENGCMPSEAKGVASEEMQDVTEVTVEEFVEVLSYWITQVQMNPSNVKFIAHNIKFDIPKLLKKRLLDFQNELISLFVSIAHLCTIQYLGDQRKAENIIEEAIGFISKIAFPSSFNSTKGLQKMIGWSTQIDQRRKSYAMKYRDWSSYTFPSMGRLFLDHFKYSKDPIMASLFLATYIQETYLKLSETLQGYKIIGV